MIDLISTIADRIREQYDAKEVILFGSYARGDQNSDSDIDLFIISDTNERFFDRMATVSRMVRGLIRKIPFSPIVLTTKELEERIKRGDQFIAEILNKGIKI
jgi:uncharacterized protein